MRYIAILILSLLLTWPALSQDTNMVFTSSSVGNGSISPDGETTLVVTGSAGDSAVTYTILPDSSIYYIDSVLIDGVNVGRIWSYTFVAGAGDTTDKSIVAYFGSSSNPISAVWKGKTIYLQGGYPWVNFYTSPSYLAYDSIYFVSSPILLDMGGVANVYMGVEVEAMTDTITDPKFVLEGSIDSTTWFAIDSVTVTTPEVVGQYRMNTDLSTHRLPYWRIRFGVPSALWQGVDSPAVPGRFHFFIAVNVKERY